jgi:hypothetical protein
MNSYVPIEDIVDRLKSDFDWPHSFIRECSFASKHCMVEYVDDSGRTVVGDVYGPQYAKLVIASAGNSQNYGIEFLFCDVENFSIKTFDELRFVYDYDKHHGHTVDFSDYDSGPECYIVAKSVMIRFLGKSYLGQDLLLGFEMPCDETVESVCVEIDWRRCSNCMNIWQASPLVEIARCPECGVMTKLRSTPE